jgi:hypothetical protein
MMLNGNGFPCRGNSTEFGNGDTLTDRPASASFRLALCCCYRIAYQTNESTRSSEVTITSPAASRHAAMS